MTADTILARARKYTGQHELAGLTLAVYITYHFTTIKGYPMASQLNNQHVPLRP